MLKLERREYILDKLQEKKSVRVAELLKELNVTDMTIRRDLQDLGKDGKLIRVHGGATLIGLEDSPLQQELSHNEKRNRQVTAKNIIAKKAAKLIHDDDSVFIGAGTTLENVYEYLEVKRAKIITNSIHIFNKFRHDNRFTLILVGGSYRPISGVFIGPLANDFIDKIKVQKAFIGVNGIFKKGAYNANEDEGLTNQHILNSASKKYIVADRSKFDKQDFYRFYELENDVKIITN